MVSPLAQLLDHPALWRGSSVARVRPGVPTGFAALDAVLPGGGWPTDGLTEIFPACRGIGELSLLLPALARLSREATRWVMLVAPPQVPYAPALAAAGIDLARVVVVAPPSRAEALWAMRQALAAGSCSAVLAWINAPDLHSLRRLQLAAERARTLAVLYRPVRAARDFSPTTLKLHLQARDGRLAVEVLKRRGARLDHPVLIDLPRVSSRWNEDRDHQDTKSTKVHQEQQNVSLPLLGVSW